MRLHIGLALWAAAVTAAAADGPDAPSAPRWQAKVDPWVLSSAAHGETGFLVFLSEQAVAQGELLHQSGPSAEGRWVGCRGTAAGITLAADLALASTPWPRRMRTGHVLSYTLTVTNAGPQAAGSVVLRQNIPFMFFPGYTQVTSSQGFCDMAGVNIRCDLGILAAGSSATVSVSATATFPGTATSFAEAWSSEPDGNPGNNTLTFTIRTVDCPPLAFCR